MTVGADDVALLDLGADRGPRPSEHVADVGHLVTQVVELEHDRVCLAAVDAAMASQVLQDERLVALASGAGVAVHPSGPRFWVFPVPALVPFDVAWLAHVLQAVSSPAVHMELRRRLDLAATAAALRHRPEGKGQLAHGPYTAGGGG